MMTCRDGKFRRGKNITDQVEILNETKQFYKDLYASTESQVSDIDLNDLLDTVEIRKLSKNESGSIEGPITYNEAAIILMAMSNNRSPESEDFKAEFF